MNISDTPPELLEIILSDMHLHNHILSKLYTPIIIPNDKIELVKCIDTNDIYINCFYNNCKLLRMYEYADEYSKYCLYNRVINTCIWNSNKKILKHYYLKEKHKTENNCFFAMIHEGIMNCISFGNLKMLKYHIKQCKNMNTQSYIYEYSRVACNKNKLSILKYLYNTLNYEYQQILFKSHSFCNFITNNSNDNVKIWLQSIGYKN